MSVDEDPTETWDGRGLREIEWRCVGGWKRGWNSGQDWRGVKGLGVNIGVGGRVRGERCGYRVVDGYCDAGSGNAVWARRRGLKECRIYDLCGGVLVDAGPLL